MDRDPLGYSEGRVSQTSEREPGALSEQGILVGCRLLEIVEL